jgi:glycosyltransferase involved in cell wall biosynthesis
MKIAIINLTGGGISGGYKKYLQNVLPRLAESNDVEEILCATPSSIDIQSWFSFLPKVKFINCKPFKWMYYRPDDDLKKSLKEFSPDIIFIPVERYFKYSRVPIVNMIQNMEPFAKSINENSFTDKCRLYIQCIVARRAIKKSDRVIAISKYVKEFLLYKWNIPEEKIGLVYHGIELPQFKEYIRPNNIPKDWEGNFLFTAGSIRPARGLEDILEAMKYLILEKVNIEGLVIAGETEIKMFSYRKKLEEWIKMHNLSSKIYWVDKLSEKEMAWCYRHCVIFVMSSRIEACPNIALEAMSYGCISISSDNSPLPEIFGDAAIYYQPKDSQSLAKTIKSVFIWDSWQREKMAELARNRVAEFSWDVCAESTVRELVKVSRNSKSNRYNKR